MARELEIVVGYREGRRRMWNL